MKYTIIKFFEILFDFVVLIVLYFITRMLRSITTILFNNSTEDIPHSYFYLWILIVFLIPFLILIKNEAFKKGYLQFLFFVYIGGNLTSNVTNFLVSFIPKVNDFEMIESNFIGIASVEESFGEDEYGGQKSIKEYNKSFVYSKNDKDIDKEFSKLENEYESGASTDKFIFWQTAMAYGYNPKNILQYKSPNLFTEKLEFYFTVGPLVILESFLLGIKDALLILILFIIVRINGRSIIFKDLEAAKKYFTVGIGKIIY